MSNDRISGESIRLGNVKKSSKNIDTLGLINRTKNLSEDKKTELVNLICYLNIALRSRYSGLENDLNIKYFNNTSKSGNFKITQKGVEKVLRSILENTIDNDDTNTILSMCTHRHTTVDSVNSFTKTAQQFFKETCLKPDYKKLKDIKKFLDSNLKLENLKNSLLNIDILIKCANNDLSNMNLQGANLQGAHLELAQLQNANLQGANLEGAHLELAQLQNANLQGANLQRAQLQWANLRGANLQGANLQGANLQRAHLEDANLQRAQLQGANLQRANLQEANLQEANLQEANLQRAQLQRANLQEANLQRAQLQRANLEGAILDDFYKIKQRYQIKWNAIPDDIKKTIIDTDSCTISGEEFADDTDVIILINDTNKNGEMIYSAFQSGALISWLKMKYTNPITRQAAVFWERPA